MCIRCVELIEWWWTRRWTLFWYIYAKGPHGTRICLNTWIVNSWSRSVPRRLIESVPMMLENRLAVNLAIWKPCHRERIHLMKSGVTPFAQVVPQFSSNSQCDPLEFLQAVHKTFFGLISKYCLVQAGGAGIARLRKVTWEVSLPNRYSLLMLLLLLLLSSLLSSLMLRLDGLLHLEHLLLHPLHLSSEFILMSSVAYD